MGWIVYAEHAGGVLSPMGSSEMQGEDAIFDVLIREGRDRRAADRPGGAERYVAYDEADGRELQVKG